MDKFDFTKLKNSLIKKGYTVSQFDSVQLASQYLNSEIDGKTVGLGGSVTLNEMDLYSSLSTHNVVYYHDNKPSNLTVMQTRTMASRAEVYISSVNAIAETGEIVNIDNTGNRVSAISYGPNKIYLVIGANKVTNSIETAIYRARNVSAPLNAKRLNKNTPCAVKGDKCYDCDSPDRICRNLSILWLKPTGAEYEIILINDNLGY